MRELTKEEMKERLVSVGWLEYEAEEEVESMFAEAEIEDGYDGP